jgi:hypothetical protein
MYHTAMIAMHDNYKFYTDDTEGKTILLFNEAIALQRELTDKYKVQRQSLLINYTQPTS